MSPTLTWLALANALFTAFASSFYMGIMLVVQFHLRRTFLGLGLRELPIYFAQPIGAATKFLSAMFVPYLISAALLIWIGWGRPVLVACAVIATAGYAFLALWYMFAMHPLNTRLLAGDVGSQQELTRMMAAWITRNWARVAATIVYWLASMGFLVGAHDLWEGLS